MLRSLHESVVGKGRSCTHSTDEVGEAGGG